MFRAIDFGRLFLVFVLRIGFFLDLFVSQNKTQSICLLSAFLDSFFGHIGGVVNNVISYRAIENKGFL
jgi:hypothetical protein